MAYKYKQGIYYPVNPEKYAGNPENITYRSSWEKRIMERLDLSPNILKWSSEELAVPYFDSVQRKKRTYYPDFAVIHQNPSGEIKKYIIEVKPFAQTLPPEKPSKETRKAKRRYLKEQFTFRNNQDKWESMRDWCEMNGFIFIILTENNVDGLFYR